MSLKRNKEKTTREELNKDIQKEIMDEKKHEKRKKGIILGLKIMFSIIFFMFAFYFYTMYVETKHIIVREHRISHTLIPESFDSSKIVHFSDLHFGTTVSLQELEYLVELINSRNPDIIIFTGNLIDINYSIDNETQENIISHLKNLNATLGKYAVSGSEDDEGQFQTILNQSGFNILNNDYELIYNQDHSPILLIGLSSLLQGSRETDYLFTHIDYNEDIYTILMMNETDGLTDLLKTHSIDLVLGGHSRNGQIRLPGLPIFSRVDGSREFADRFYEVDGTSIFISSGIGTKDPGFRFFARPSINFFRLSSK